jgi:hypothetical protein
MLTLGSGMLGSAQASSLSAQVTCKAATAHGPRLNGTSEREKMILSPWEVNRDTSL